MYRFAPEYFFEAFGPILGCLKMTAIITLCSFALAFVLAIILALLAMMKNRVVQVILKFWLSLFRGTPLIAQLFLFVYGVFPLLPGGSSMSLEAKAVLCLAPQLFRLYGRDHPRRHPVRGQGADGGAASPAA